MSSFFKSIDQLGKGFDFNIDGGIFKTAVGGVFTILLGLVTCFFTWYFGNDLYYKEKPSFLIKEDMLKHQPVINNTYIDKFGFAFKVETSEGILVSSI